MLERPCRMNRWPNNQNKLCRSRKVMKLCNWQLFDLQSSCHAKLCLNLKKLFIIELTQSTTGDRLFAECCFSGTRQSGLCRVFFLTLGKEPLCRMLFFDTQQRKFQSIFWSSKLIQMKKFSTTKLYNSSRCTMFVLVFSSYDKVKINLFTNLTYLSCSLWNYKRDI